MTTHDGHPGSEQGVEISHDQLDPETLQRLIEEFVSRDGADWDQDDGSLEAKVRQVTAQLKNGRTVIVFDLTSQTANLVERK